MNRNDFYSVFYQLFYLYFSDRTMTCLLYTSNVVIHQLVFILQGKEISDILQRHGCYQPGAHIAVLHRIGGISESSLINQLRSLEEDGFISRHDYKELPPRVEYSLTDLGQSFMPIMEHIKDWGETHLLPLSSSR